jgi:hypothetical protein
LAAKIQVQQILLLWDFGVRISSGFSLCWLAIVLSSLGSAPLGLVLAHLQEARPGMVGPARWAVADTSTTRQVGWYRVELPGEMSSAGCAFT